MDTWIDERGHERGRCMCGMEPSTHPDDAFGGLEYCGDCNAITCAQCRTYERLAAKCLACAPPEVSDEDKLRISARLAAHNGRECPKCGARKGIQDNGYARDLTYCCAGRQGCGHQWDREAYLLSEADIARCGGRIRRLK